ncbi:MAG TPA: hypothetical protein VFO34_14505 [Candidatus Acidoferrales bacterium]|nr:hypothetical protein [Candidatus Acidoferrales bacterium]
MLRRMVENQHASDHALEVFERTERRELRPRAGNGPTDEDRSYRVVPTGTGFVRVLVAENGRPVSAADYRKGMLELQKALEDVLDSNNPRAHDDFAKRDRRTRERTTLIDAVREAYIVTSIGTELRDGHTLQKFRLEPNPAYRPKTRTMEFMSHTRATIWVEEKSASLAQIGGEVVSDVSFGAGIGKVYRGATLFMRQQEVQPGVWLPEYYQTDYTARKLFFVSETHERITTVNYRRIGPPAEALAEIKRELKVAADPR